MTVIGSKSALWLQITIKLDKISRQQFSQSTTGNRDGKQCEKRSNDESPRVCSGFLPEDTDKTGMHAHGANAKWKILS